MRKSKLKKRWQVKLQERKDIATGLHTECLQSCEEGWLFVQGTQTVEDAIIKVVKVGESTMVAVPPLERAALL